MRKKTKKTTAKAPAKAPAKVEVKEKASLTSQELVLKISEVLKKEGALGYACAIVGPDSRILPFAAAASVGDLLTIKYALEKEISKLIESTSKK